MNSPRSIEPIATRFSEQLLTWFDTHGRHDLPWQQDISAYRVWVSEIMLQQTQVATVIDYFSRFMQRFPTVTDLAKADIDEVLHLWSGLGYYARGRNLHKAAKIIRDQHGGELPDTLEEITALPGIGRSTGSAILAIAHGKRHAILDGNVKRVLTRLQCISGPPDASATQKVLWPLADSLTPHERIGDYTQAIMDLGATVCSRRNPACDMCPVNNLCAAKETGRQAEFPNRKPRKNIPTKHARFLKLINSAQSVLLYRRPPSGIWGGLWCLPELKEGESIQSWCENNGYNIQGKPFDLAPHRHTFTHFHLEMSTTEIAVSAKSSIIMDTENYVWYNPLKPKQLGLAKPMTKFIHGN